MQFMYQSMNLPTVARRFHAKRSAKFKLINVRFKNVWNTRTKTTILKTDLTAVPKYNGTKKADTSYEYDIVATDT